MMLLVRPEQGGIGIGIQLIYDWSGELSELAALIKLRGEVHVGVKTQGQG